MEIREVKIILILKIFLWSRVLWYSWIHINRGEWISLIS